MVGFALFNHPLHIFVSILHIFSLQLIHKLQGSQEVIEVLALRTMRFVHIAQLDDCLQLMLECFLILIPFDLVFNLCFDIFDIGQSIFFLDLLHIDIGVVPLQQLDTFDQFLVLEFHLIQFGQQQLEFSDLCDILCFHLQSSGCQG